MNTEELKQDQIEIDRRGLKDRVGLPEGWRWVNLGDVSAIIVGRTPRRDVPIYWNGTLPWATITDLNEKVLYSTKERITQQGAEESRSRLLKAGTLLFSFKLTIGKMAIAGIDLYTNEAIAGLIPIDDQVLDRDYLRFALRSIDTSATSSHAVKGKTLNQELLNLLSIPLPPLPEQKRIAAILNEQLAAVEKARAAAEAQLRAAKGLPAAYLREVFESDEARGWEKAKLGEVLTLRKEVIHPYDHPEGPAKFVGLEHIELGNGIRVGEVDVEMSQLTGRKPKFYSGDIVYGYLRPYLNKVWIAEFDGLCSVDQYVYSVDSNKAEVNFVAWFMRSATFLKRAPIKTTPGQLPRIRTEEVASVEINLPSLEIQHLILAQLEAKLSKAGQTVRALESQSVTLDQLPATFLQKAFRGEV